MTTKLQMRLQEIAEQEADRLFGSKKTKFGTCTCCGEQFPLRGCSICDKKLDVRCLSCHLELEHDIVSDEILTYRDGENNEKAIAEIRARGDAMNSGNDLNNAEERA